MAAKGPDNWLSHGLRQAPWRVQTQATSIVAMSVIVVLVIGALYLAQATSTATTGRDLQELETHRQELEQQNSQIEAEIASMRSVPRLTQRALDLGFRPATAEEIEYLPVEGLPPAATPQPGPVEPDIPVYDETLSGWLRAQWVRLATEFGGFLQADDDA